MQYRKFGSLDWQGSALGFGCMRLPTTGDDNSNIDEEIAIKMIRRGIDNGINYVDTAWPYHGGNSEIVVGKALQDGYREKTKLATKLPIWKKDIEGEKELNYYLNKQLEKLQTDHIDFYLLHALSRKDWEKCKKLNIFNWLEKVRKEGKIIYIGFSFHDELPLFKEIVDAYNWDFCQIQYNYMDTDYQAGRKGLKYAASKGLAVVIMEPLRGGTLASEPPAEIQGFFDQLEKNRNQVNWALQWLWDQPKVSLVLSGMSTMQHVKDNVKYASESGINSLNDVEREIFKKIRNKYREITPIMCTDCQYCMPCPNGVNIPRNFSLYNYSHLYYDTVENENMRKYYIMDEKNRASSCISCQECEEKCPQNLGISSLMEKVAGYFAKDKE